MRLSRFVGRLSFAVACASIVFLATSILGLIWRVDGLKDIPLEVTATAGVCFVAASSILMVQRLFVAVSGRGGERGRAANVKSASKFDKETDSFEI